MAVMSVTVIQVKPGRFEDYLAMTKRSDALLAECGAKNLRLIVGLAAGEASGAMVSTWEADDFTEYGKVTDAFSRRAAPRSWRRPAARTHRS